MGAVRWVGGSGGRLEDDPVAEPFELVEGASAAVLGVVATQEVVTAQVPVGGLGAQHVPDGDQLAVRDRGQGTFAAPAGGDAAIQGMQVGALLAQGAQGGGAEGGLEPAVARAGVCGLGLAGGLVVTRGTPRPRRRGARRW